MDKGWLYKGRRAYRMKNYAAAIDYYEQAIAEGDTEAMYLAALMYQSGTGVPKSICKARALFGQAAEAGLKKAANALAMLANTSYIQRHVYVDEVCRLRENGKYKEAMEEFLFIVNGTDKPDDYVSECMYWIGVMYKLGQGVPKDDVVAEEWLKKAVANSSYKPLKELKIDERMPEVICEDDCAKAEAYVYHNISWSKNLEVIMPQLAWGQGTKLHICAEGEDAEEVVKTVVELFYNKFSDKRSGKMLSQGAAKREDFRDEAISKKRKIIEFDEEKLIRQCMQKFADIRRAYNLDEDTLRQVEQNPILKSLAERVREGCTEQGIKEIEKKLPDWIGKNGWGDWNRWEDWNNWHNYIGGGFACIDIFNREPLDITAEWVKRMCDYYRVKCESLNDKIEQVHHDEEIIREKEQLADAGDVRAMFFLRKANEMGCLCVRDGEKVRDYAQMAKDVWAGDLAEEYKTWLDKAVQDSGLEWIGRLGREYIEGTFAEAAKKNNSIKLKKELKWLDKAIEAGDGWAAFTKGNICYYGYGRWGEKKKEAYINYQKAAESKESIYALEYGEFCFRNGDLQAKVVNALVKAVNA